MCAAIPDPYLPQAARYEVRMTELLGSEATGYARGESVTFSARSNCYVVKGLPEGSCHEVCVRARTSDGSASLWTDALEIIVVPDAVFETPVMNPNPTPMARRAPAFSSCTALRCCQPGQALHPIAKQMFRIERIVALPSVVCVFSRCLTYLALQSGSLLMTEEEAAALYAEQREGCASTSFETEDANDGERSGLPGQSEYEASATVVIDSATMERLRLVFDELAATGSGPQARVRRKAFARALQNDSRVAAILGLPARVRVDSGDEDGERDTFEAIFQDVENGASHDDSISWSEFCEHLLGHSLATDVPSPAHAAAKRAEEAEAVAAKKSQAASVAAQKAAAAEQAAALAETAAAAAAEPTAAAASVAAVVQGEGQAVLQETGESRRRDGHEDAEAVAAPAATEAEQDEAAAPIQAAIGSADVEEAAAAAGPAVAAAPAEAAEAASASAAVDAASDAPVADATPAANAEASEARANAEAPAAEAVPSATAAGVSAAAADAPATKADAEGAAGAAAESALAKSVATEEPAVHTEPASTPAQSTPAQSTAVEGGEGGESATALPAAAPASDTAPQPEAEPASEPEAAAAAAADDDDEPPEGEGEESSSDEDKAEPADPALVAQPKAEPAPEPEAARVAHDSRPGVGDGGIKSPVEALDLVLPKPELS